MAGRKSKVKEALGWLTGDREVEAEARAEQEAGGEPNDSHVADKLDEVHTKYGETADGTDAPDARH